MKVWTMRVDEGAKKYMLKQFFVFVCRAYVRACMDVTETIMTVKKSRDASSKNRRMIKERKKD